MTREMWEGDPFRGIIELGGDRHLVLVRVIFGIG